MLKESRITRALVWGSALALSLTGVAQAQRSTVQQVSLPEGTVLRAELKDPLSSVDSRPGDRFTATIQSDRDGSGLPTGTEVTGQVRTVRKASSRQPGTIEVDFQTLRVPDGRSFPITGSLTSLDSNSVRRTADGRIESRSSSSSSKDRTKFIGYGAGAGALIGALSGGDLLTSGLLGAAAGYLYGQLNKDKERSGGYSDVNLKAGTEFGVELQDRLIVASASDSGRFGDRYRRSQDRASGYDTRYDSRYSRNDDRLRENDIRVYLNDRDVRFLNSRPFMSGGRVMVPLAPVLDAAGYRHRYDTRLREVTVYGDRGNARLAVGDTSALVDGERVRLDAPAQLIDGVLYVPTQFLEEATDIRAEWDADRRTLRLTGRGRAL